MAEQGGGLWELLGPDLSADVLRCLDDPADLVRLASVSQSWRRFVITHGFCRKLCLRMMPEISGFVRVIEVGSLPDTVQVSPNCSGQRQELEREHNIYAYLGYRSVSRHFLTGISADKIANVLPNEGRSSLTLRLSCEFCAVHAIKIQPLQVFRICEPGLPETVRFRLGHMTDGNATSEESLAGNFIWTYISSEFSMIHTDEYQSINLKRPVICIRGVIQIELLGGVQNNPWKGLLDISFFRVKVMVCPLTPEFTANPFNRMGSSILMYFPGAEEQLQDVYLGRPTYWTRSRRKFSMRSKRRKNNHQQF